MACNFIEKDNLFVLTTADSEYQIRVDSTGLLFHLYYGRKTSGQNMAFAYIPQDRGFSGNLYEDRSNRGRSIDTMPMEYSGCGIGDYRAASLQVVNPDGSRSCDLRYVSHTISSVRSEIPGLPFVRQNDDAVTELQIVTEDKVSGLQVTLVYDIFEEKNVITRRAVFTNNGAGNMILGKASSVTVDFLYGDFDVIHFHGRHACERLMERQPVTHNIQTFASSRGMSSHHENPFVILCDKDTNEEYGSCYGFMFMYSGNHKTEIEKNQADSTRIVMGINDENFDWTLEPGDTFCTPEVIMTYSAKGLSSLSHAYHNIIQNNVIAPKYRDRKRSVLINNWEATYFNFDTDKILDIAKSASEIGVDMLVLDDGWFGKRDDDNSGLGDWFVNEKKLPGGLKRVADGVNALGMKFGLWFEPEMVNEDADLFRAHPDWALRDPNRDPNMSRNQMVLDMGNPAVVDYLSTSISAVLDSANIEYVKWDYNRAMANVYSNVLSPERQGEASHRFMLGTYELLDRLLTAHPTLMIEGCAGGGGRFDAGMLFYCPQIWTSDNTDAIERLKIHHGTSFGYPASAVGSHVSASPNHQTGRQTALNTRGITAMSGTFGYELDLTKLTQQEKEKMKQQIETFHRFDSIVQHGTYYRLSNPTENEYYTSWEFVAADGSEAIMMAVMTHVEANPRIPNIKWKGLEENAVYTVKDAEAEADKNAGGDEALEVTGAALMYGGYPLKEILGAFDPYKYGSYPAFMIHAKKN